MATPFVRLEPCSSSPAVGRTFFGWFMAAIAFGISLGARWTGANAAHPMSLERLLIWVPVIAVLTRLVMDWNARATQRFHDVAIRWQATRFRGRRLQCIRGMSDEASLAIAGGLIGEGAGRFASVIIGKLGLFRVAAGNRIARIVCCFGDSGNTTATATAFVICARRSGIGRGAGTSAFATAVVTWFRGFFHGFCVSRIGGECARLRFRQSGSCHASDSAFERGRHEAWDLRSAGMCGRGRQGNCRIRLAREGRVL